MESGDIGYLSERLNGDYSAAHCNRSRFQNPVRVNILDTRRFEHLCRCRKGLGR